MASLKLEGMTVSKNKNGKYQSHLTEINGDGYKDIVIQFNTADCELTAESETATITGMLSDDRSFEGSDDVTIVIRRKVK